MSQAGVQAAAAIAPEPRVGIVLVHFNCLDDTLRCLGSLADLNYSNYFVLIIDGASPDGSGVVLQRALGGSRMTVLLSPENAGFAAANNVGIRHAIVEGAEYVWLLNPDTSVHPEALSSLVTVCRDTPRVAAVGSKIFNAPRERAVDFERDRTIWSAGATIDFSAKEVSMRGAGETDSGQYDQIFEADYLPGCSLLFRSDLVHEVGYLPEDYFMYFEETDWCMRIRRKGYSLRCVPESLVWHHFEHKKVNEAFGVYYYNRNQRIFWFRYGTPAEKAKIAFETLLKRLPEARRALRAAPDEAHRRIFCAHVDSCMDFLCGRFGKRQGLSR